jgi:hypothetical protein
MSCRRAAARREESDGGSPRLPMYLSASFRIASLCETSSTSGRKFFVPPVGANQIDHRNKERISSDLDDLLISQSPEGKVGAVGHDVTAMEADRDVALAGADVAV